MKSEQDEFFSPSAVVPTIAPTVTLTAAPSIQKDDYIDASCTTSGCTSTSSPSSACGSGSICISTSLNGVPESAFKDAIFLTSVSFSGCFSLNIIERGAFINASSLTSIDFSDLTSLQNIGEAAFQDTVLTSVDLNGLTSLKYISDYAFQVSRYTVSVSRPDASHENQIINQYTTVESIDLGGCSALTIIENNAFSPMKYNGTDTIDGVSYTYIVNYYNTIYEVALNLTGVVALQTIGEYAFAYNSIRSLDTSDLLSLSVIGDYAFYGTKLSSVRIPANVSSIGSYAFGGISTLTFVCWEGGEPAFVASDAFSGSSVNASAILNCSSTAEAAPTASPTAPVTPSVVPTVAPSSNPTQPAPTAEPTTRPTPAPTTAKRLVSTRVGCRRYQLLRRDRKSPLSDYC